MCRHGRRRGSDGRIAAELRHELLVCVKVGEDDDLSDLRVLITVPTGGCEAAPPASAATCAPADVSLARVAFGKRLFLGGPSIDERQGDVGLALFDIDPASQRTNSAGPPAEMTENASHSCASSAAA